MVSRPATAWVAGGRPRARRVFLAAAAFFGAGASAPAVLRFMGALLSTKPGGAGSGRRAKQCARGLAAVTGFG